MIQNKTKTNKILIINIVQLRYLQKVEKQKNLWEKNSE